MDIVKVRKWAEVFVYSMFFLGLVKLFEIIIWIIGF